MSLVIGENISHQYGAEEVLRHAAFRVGETDRIGLVGPNGEGKTTLLRIIAGSLEPTLGEAHRRQGLSIGYLPQDPPALEGTTVHQAMLEAPTDLRRMERQLHEMESRLAEAADDASLLREYGEVQAAFEARGVYHVATRIEQVLTGLGFERAAWSQPLSELSGGQRTRAYLATLLLKGPDLLLLDEPTNHLDLESVEWLEGWLSSFGGAIVLVSHDRWFLDRVTTRTWEVASRHLECYRGSYSHYLRQRAERFKERMRTWKAQQEHIAKTREFIRIHIAGQRTKEAQGRRKRLERFIRDEAIERPHENATIHLRLSPGPRTGQIVLRARDLRAGYDPGVPLVEAEELEVQLGDRVAVIGPNGSGKTTLVRTLLGELPPLSGEIVRGARVNVGYLSQTQAELVPDATALEAVRAAQPGISSQDARTLLGSLLLTEDDVFKKVRELSGGQRSRVVLARLVVQKTNVLVLDEPTNHLDIPSTEILQDVLERFDGSVVFVTHDRYLIQSVATHIWALEPAGPDRGRGSLSAPAKTGERTYPPNGSLTPPSPGRRGSEAASSQCGRGSLSAPDAQSRKGLHRGGQAAPATTRSAPNIVRPLGGGWDGYLQWRSIHGGETAGSSAEDAREGRRQEHRRSRREANRLTRLRRRHEELEAQIASLEEDLRTLNNRISTAGEQSDLDSINRLGEEYRQKDSRLKALWEEWEKVGGELE